MNFQNIQAGDRVTYRTHAGTGLKGPEYKQATHKVNPLLIFSTHVVVNTGGRHGAPQVVDENNFIEVKRSK